MAGRYETDRDWDWREEPQGRRSGGDRWEGREDRSFGPPDRVFGERDSGMGYNMPREDWQAARYTGVSPAAKRGDYETGYRALQHEQRSGDIHSGRFYGDHGRGPGYASPEGPGRGLHEGGRRFGSREADARYARAIGQPYDDSESFEDRARDAGGMLRRTGERIAGWFSDVAGDLRGEPDGDGRFETQGSARGLGPKGYRRSDERISEDVHQRLTDDPWLDASDVEVAVSSGEVTLSGVVKSREAKHRAEHLVEAVSCVKHVQNNLRIATTATSSSAAYGGSSMTAGRDASDGVNDSGVGARSKT
jgi:osmotically-inducible protein OsmY